MANPRRSATIMPSIAAVEADAGPAVSAYCIPLDKPHLFQWVPSDTSTIDHDTVLGYTGGTIGRWLIVAPVNATDVDQASNLTDANAAISYSSASAWYRMPSATLTANRTLTLRAAGAEEGNRLEFTRADQTIYTLTFVNDGGSTLLTMPASLQWCATFYFDGTDWILRSGGPMEATP